MKFVTKNLTYFAVVATALTFAFRFALSAMLAKESDIYFVPAIFYSLSMFAAGWYFGYKDGRDLPIYDVGFRFHLATYIQYFVATGVVFLLGYNAEVEKWENKLITALVWGFFLAVHFVFYLIYRKRTIDGLKKEDLFD